MGEEFPGRQDAEDDDDAQQRHLADQWGGNCRVS
jgi:hypothetical protein